MKKDWALGLVHLYTGDGKGKTTAAVGLALRAVGAGLRVVFAQFMKGGKSSELELLARCGVRVVHREGSKKFVFAMNDGEKAAYREVQGRTFADASALAEDCDMLVFDEIISAVGMGMIDLEVLTDFLRTKPGGLEVVMTGRDAPREITDKANYISNITCVRHPYEAGVAARLGIEY